MEDFMALHQVSRGRAAIVGFIIAVALCPLLLLPVVAQETAAERSKEEAQQAAVAARFLTVLEKTPRRGTALDRVYGHHVEFGTLSDFLAGLKRRVEAKADDSVAWMLLGLIEAHRGEDAQAVDAFRKAEALRPQDALAPYYLGQSLLLIGQPEEAVQAFERAIERKPARNDLLEIFQQLGRVHQRAQRPAEAMKVWERLEALFPDDPRVQEQIAVTLMEEGEFKLALPRFEKLAELVKDDYRRTTFLIQAADLKIREGQKDAGLASLEAVLANLNPESWLHRDVRRRIEEVFLRSGDQDGLVQYYERWLAAHADDVDGMARLARFLASAARIPEATTWMEKALKLAPKRTELRKAFIDQLVDDQRYAEAVKQYALLLESDSGNVDFLRDWGKLVTKDKEQPQDARTKEATRIWRSILAARPGDAPTTAQVADLFRQANLNDEAVALYQQAVQQAPEDPQYREYLGEFYHVLKRSEQAQKTWQEIVSGARHTAVNVARLAEIYNSFGYLDQAVAQIADACQLDPKDFSLQLKAAEFHARASKWDPALAFVAAAEKLAATDDEREAVVNQRIEVYQASDRLEEEIAKLAEQTAANAAADAGAWRLLARYYEADRRWTEATEAISTALEKDAKSVVVLATAARIAEQSGDFARAAEMNRQLADADRRSRGDYLMNVARLEAQLGRNAEALQAGKDLIVSAPGNTDNYEFYAQLCFRLGESEEGLTTLRTAVRINPTEPHLIMALGAALAEQFRADEAIEVYWRAFERSEELEDKVTLTTKLTELYLESNQFEQLVERFERDRREDDKRREMTICLAQAHHSSGDYGTARRELESLLSEDTRDTNLLQQLSKLCEESADIDAAVEYQRQLARIAPGHEAEFRLANLLQTRGDRDEASEIFVALTRREENKERLLRSLDSLLSQGSFESVLAITEPLLSEQRDDWELLYREGVAWNSLEKPDEALTRFERLLTLKVPYDALGVAAEEKLKQAQAKAKSENTRGNRTEIPKRPSPLEMLNMSSQIRAAVGLDPDRGYYGGGMGMGRQPQAWMPDSFGMARMASLGWLLKAREDAQAGVTTETPVAENSPLDAFSKRAEAADASRESLYDWLFLEQLRGNADSIYRIAVRLAKSGEADAQRFFLNSLSLRGMSSEGRRVRRSSAGEGPKRTPLGEEELALMLRCYESLAAKDPTKDALASGGQVVYAADGSIYMLVGGSYVRIGQGAGGLLGVVAEELKLAGREAQATAMLDKLVADSRSVEEVVGAMQLLQSQEKYDQLPPVYEKWTQAAKAEVAKSSAAAPAANARNARGGDPGILGRNAYILVQWMGRLGADEEHARILGILDPALDLAVAEGQLRIAQRKPNSRTPTVSVGSGHSWHLYYGKEGFQSEASYPPDTLYVDQSALMLLREVFEVFKRNDVSSDLTQRLRERTDKADSKSKAYEQLMLGYVLWWMEEQEDALEQLRAATDQLAGDPLMRLEIANLYEQRGDFDDALAIVDSLAPRDQQLVQRREQTALRLAERIGDIDRARASAERLFGLRLDNDTQLALVDQMRRLGLHELAESIVARVHRRAGNQSSSLASLMSLYQGQGKTVLAQQLAHTLLRRTAPAMSSLANGRNPMRSRTPDSGTRMQAIAVLQQTGGLAPLIERLEAQLEKSPSSPRLYDQLIELHQATNNRKKAQELLEKAVAAMPKAVALRYQLAQQLDRAGKASEACDQYLEVLKLRPDWVTDELYNIRRTFDRCQRTLDLVKAFQTMNLKSFRQPYYVIDLASELMRDEKNQDIAVSLLERLYADFPSYRNQLVNQIHDSQLWKNPRIYQLGKRGLLPTKEEVATSPWFGVSEITSYSGDGQANGAFQQLLSGIQGTDHAKDLRSSIEAKLVEMPDWYGGASLLALMDISEGQGDRGRERLEKLLSDEGRVKEMPSVACWLLGQELDDSDNTRPLALRLLERAVNEERSMSQLEYSPLTHLLKLYLAEGRKDDARAAMLKQLNGQQTSMYDAQYSSYQRVENSVWAGRKMLELGFPVEAVKIYQGLGGDQSLTAIAAQWNGNEPDHYQSQIALGVKQAFEALDDSNAAEAMAQLLTVSDKTAPDKAALDLMVNVPEGEALRQQSMQSPLVGLLESISKQEPLRIKICDRLRELRSEHPEDLSIGIALAALELSTKGATADEAIAALDGLVTAHSLAEIPAGRRPNSRQRREALLSVPLWLVARECLASPERAAHGERLAARALDASRRQVDKKYTVAILFNWGQRAIAQGNRELAEKKWTELLDLATQRPQRKAAAAPDPGTPPARPAGQFFRRPPTSLRNAPNSRVFRQVSQIVEPSEPAEEADPNVVPPLTMSQFRVAIEVACAAAENNMPELSRKAMRTAMLGGQPVPDAATDSVATPTTRVMVTRGGYASSMSVSQANEGEVDVAASTKRVLGLWTGDAYPPEEVYELLHLIVLPPARSTEILFFPDSSELQEAKAQSLGATLVAWAKRANRLDDLQRRVEARKQNPASRVAALVLETQIALARDETDTARERLKELDDDLSASASPENAQLACHAALPASDHKPLEDVAYSILKRALQGSSQGGEEGMSVAGKLAIRVNRRMASNPEEVKAFYDQYLLGRQAMYARYGGDYGEYMQWNEYANIARAAAQAGLPMIALDYLGRVADFTSRRYSQPDVSLPLAVVHRELNQLPPAERYEAWRGWTMPQEGRQTVRFSASYVQPMGVPREFLSEAVAKLPFHSTDFLCNFVDLLDAAEAAGKLAALRTEAARAREQKLANADALWLLASIRLGDVAAAEPAVRAAIRTVGERTKPKGEGEEGEEDAAAKVWPEYLLYRECLRSPAFAAIYAPQHMELMNALRPNREQQLLERIDNDYAQHAAAELGANLRPGDSTLVHWAPASTLQSSKSSIKPWWVAQEGHIVHLGGSSRDILAYRYPLTGNFTFSVDCYKASWRESDVGYGGVIMGALGFWGSSTVLSVGGHDTINVGTPLARNADGFNHVEIRVKDGVVQFVVNNHLHYEEPVVDTSPWLLLFAERPRITAFKNLKITGDPVIPREVKLVSGDRMDGWNSTNYGEQQPPRRLMKQTPRDENDSVRYQLEQLPSEFDWQAKDGILEGKAQDLPDDAQSWIYYHRPLQDGETVRYEFLYSPGRSSAFPTIGRLAMLLHPAGVRAHWVSDPTWDAALLDLQQANEIDEPAYRRGPAALPLRENDWNQVETTVRGDTVVVSLNGTVVYERPLDPALERTFGIFRRRNQSSQVRGLTLTGPWPETLSAALREDMVAARPLENPADARLLHDLVGEFAQLNRPAELLEEVNALADEDGYRRLKEWVLPTATRDSVRLYFERRPLADKPSPETAILCPAVELTRLAKRLGRLGELARAVGEIAPRNPATEQAQAALAALVALEASDLATAEAQLAKLYTMIDKLPKQTPLEQRMASFVATWRALQSPELRFAGYELALKLQALERDGETYSGLDDWRVQVDGLAGDAERALSAASTSPGASQAAFTQWQEVPYFTLDRRGKGFRPSSWRLTRGAAQHVYGENHSLLFFQSPLRGKFEILVDRPLHDWRDTVVSYGMMAADPRPDFKAKRVTRGLFTTTDIDAAVNVPREGWLARCRIAVDGNKISTYYNDVLVHEEVASGPPDPWLIARAYMPGCRATLHNLRIVGTPEIPEAIDLVAADRWQGWRADLYREVAKAEHTEEPVQWRKNGDEIVAQTDDNQLPRSRESLLMYHRPLLEDGVIEFESYFVPGETTVYPAIGRAAFLVRPQGVALHRLTNAEWEMSGLTPDNEFPLPGSAPVALKEKTWNKYRLAVKGNMATLSVNDVEVAKHELAEPPAERFFGLFRSASKDKCRVRKVIYRGEWPKQLPPVEAQELAAGPVALAGAQASEKLEIDLSKPLADLAGEGIEPLGPPERVSVSPAGTHLALAQAVDFHSWPGLVLKRPTAGDFDVILDFADLKLAKVGAGWGNGVSFKIVFAVPDRWAEVGVYMDEAGQEQLRCTFGHKRPDGSSFQDSRNVNGRYEAGRLRVVRAGGLVHCLFGQPGTEDFVLLETFAVGGAPVSEFKLETVSSDATGAVDVVASKLTLICPADAPATANLGIQAEPAIK